MRMVGRQKKLHYIRMEYFGFIDVLSSVIPIIKDEQLNSFSKKKTSHTCS